MAARYVSVSAEPTLVGPVFLSFLVCYDLSRLFLQSFGLILSVNITHWASVSRLLCARMFFLRYLDVCSFHSGLNLYITLRLVKDYITVVMGWEMTPKLLL